MTIDSVKQDRVQFMITHNCNRRAIFTRLAYAPENSRVIRGINASACVDEVAKKRNFSPLASHIEARLQTTRICVNIRDYGIFKHYWSFRISYAL